MHIYYIIIISPTKFQGHFLWQLMLLVAEVVMTHTAVLCEVVQPLL